MCHERFCDILQGRRRSFMSCSPLFIAQYLHRGPTQSVWVADYYFIVNVLDLPFASPIVVIYR